MLLLPDINDQTLFKNKKLSNYKKFLISIGCTLNRTKGGHEMWGKEGLSRPIVLQSHIDPVPEFIIRGHLKVLGISNEDFFEIWKTL